MFLQEMNSAFFFILFNWVCNGFKHLIRFFAEQQIGLTNTGAYFLSQEVAHHYAVYWFYNAN